MKFKMKWFVLIAWMLVIFLFSAQTGVQSSESSGLVEQLFALFPFIPQKILGVDLHLIIRKGAHFTEYLILYVLMFSVLIDYRPLKKALVYSVIGVFLYACTDEIHQAFVPGRASAFTDVLIDTLGGIVGMMMIAMINQIQTKRQKER